VLTTGCGNASKSIAILKQLQTYFEAKHEKRVGTLFPRVPAPLHSSISYPFPNLHKADEHNRLQQHLQAHENTRTD